MFQKAFSPLLNYLLPPLCASCRCVVSVHKSLCARCWNKLQFISQPFCEQCAYPFDFGINESFQKCGKCLEKEPAYIKTRAAFRYDDFSKKLILSFKHGDAIQLNPLLAHFMYEAGKDILTEAHFLIPVPLHWTRLLKRGYNQAAPLAKGIQKISGIPVRVEILKRVKRTPSQGGLSTDQRLENVRAAFKIPKKYKPLIKDRIIVLIDDVRTTGATLEHCSKTLLKAGAKEVRVLVTARVK